MKSVMLSRRDRRALLAAASVIPTLLVLGRGVPAALRWNRTMRAHTVAATAALARARTRIGMRHALLDSLRARETRLIPLMVTLLPGQEPGSAGATLAGLVAKAAQTAGVRLTAVQPLAAASSDSAAGAPFASVAVRAQATGDIRGLVRWLGALEGGPTDLAIRAFVVTQPDPAGRPGGMETLDLTLTIEGLMRVTDGERAR